MLTSLNFFKNAKLNYYEVTLRLIMFAKYIIIKLIFII